MSRLPKTGELIATILRICENEGRSSAVEVLRRSTFEVEEIDYDGRDGGLTAYTLRIRVAPEFFARIAGRVSAIERTILTHANAVIRDIPDEYFRMVTITPQVVAASSLQSVNVRRVAPEELIKELEAQKALMVAVATGGQPIKEVEEEYRARRTRIQIALRERNIKDPNPFSDLWAWYGKWSADLPKYVHRRQYLSEIYEPLFDQIRSEADNRSALTAVEPTGWDKIDRILSSLDPKLRAATAEEDFQGIGHSCREVLISLAQIVFDPHRHPTIDGVEIGSADSKRMLEAYLAVELPGEKSQKTRRYAKAVVDLANELQHRQTATFRDAALCAEATVSVVNLLAIISGRRDL